MKQQTKSNPKEQINDATVNFIKSVCTRITEALDEITSSCTEEPDEKYKVSSLGHSQGIGLFLYIKQSQQALKNKFPAFTDNQIMNILIAKWQNLSETEKKEYYAKFNVNQFRGSKKLKKLDKMAQKFANSLQTTQNIVSQQKKSLEKTTNQSINALQKNANIRYCEKVQVLQRILEQQDCDNFFDEPQQQKPSTPNQTPHLETTPLKTTPIQATPIQTTSLKTQPCNIRSIKLSFHPTASISIQPKTDDKSPESLNLQQLLQTQEKIIENQSQKFSQIPIIESHKEQEKKIQQTEDEKKKLTPQKQYNQLSEVDASIVAMASNNSNEISSIQSNNIIGKQQINPQSHESKENNNLSSPSEQSEEQNVTLGPKHTEMDDMKCFDENASAQSNDLSQKSLEINSRNDNQSETPYFQAVSEAEEHLECQKLS